VPRLAAFSLITDHVNTAEIYLLPPRLSYATILDPSWPCSLLSDGRAFHTGESRPQEVEAGDLRPLVAGAVDHRVEAATSTPMLRTSGSPHPTVTRPAFRGALAAFCCRRIGDRALHTSDSRPRRPQEAGSGNLPPLVAGAVDHRSEQLR
jgi:hypothetical protein